MLKRSIEYYIRKLLTGEAQKNALEFAAYLRANDMPPVRFRDNYWKDKCYWTVRVNGEYVCFVLLNGSPAQDKTEPECWVVWSDDTETATNKWYENGPIDDRMKEIAWRHVDCCNCGTEGNPARRRSIFGKDFDPVCASIFRFDNPDAEALECAKKMAELRKNDILKNRD